MPRNKKTKMPNQRQLRVGELIRHALADMLIRQEIHDDFLETHSISVTEIEMAPNLRHAKIFVVSQGGANDAELIEALNAHKGYIRGRIGNIVHLKYVPTIDFAIDKSFDNYNKISTILNRPEVKADIEKIDDDKNIDD